MTQQANRGRVTGPVAPDHHAVNPRRRVAHEGGFAWAEKEMVQAQRPSALVLSTDVKAARTAGAAPAGVPAGGAELDLVMSRELAAVINAGLSAATARLVHEHVGTRGVNDRHWYVPSLLKRPVVDA